MLLHESLKNYRLILASRSPRRQQLMRDCGLAYELSADYEVEEIFPDTLPAAEAPLYLARLKSEAYPHPLEENDLLITADTGVILDDRMLGKPADRAGAVAMLEALSGRSHRVVTGVALRTRERSHAFDATSEVFFKTLSAEEIAYYVDNYLPYDKAGAYGIQEWIGYVGITRIEGSFYNVMGLPIQKLCEQLTLFL